MPTATGQSWVTLSTPFATCLPPPPGYPPIDFARALRVCTEGVPLAGNYECSFAAVRARNLYDNHPAGVHDHYAVIREKFALEEANSFHIHMPRFIWRFIDGLFLAPLIWVLRKGKGRICIDPSSRISRSDDGAANDFIPAPGTLSREDECPPVFYASALARHLAHIWRLRISYPTEDILQFVDDLHATFHRILYHPDAGILFASIFQEFLIVPVGTIFGARNSPSFFTLTSEARAHVVSCTHFRDDDSAPALTDLARRVRLVEPPTEAERLAFAPAVPDTYHSGVPREFLTRYDNATFVDDNGVIDIAPRIPGAIDNSVRSAYRIYGSPDDDTRRQSCFAEDKWHEQASFQTLFLGFLIDTRSMVMAWPLDKRRKLRELIDSILSDHTPRQHPRQISALLGLHSLNSAMAHHAASPLKRRWWRSTWVTIPPDTISDLRLLRSTLDDPDHPVWCRPIGLLVPRELTGIALSDASNQGMGGWSLHFHFMWHLHRNDLIAVGFDLAFLTDEPGTHVHVSHRRFSSYPDEHINVLEFVALIINLWFTLVSIQHHGPIPGSHIISLLADNTSALSWMRYTARSHRPVVRDLARFCMALTLACSVPTKVSGRHLAGTLNNEADALSRFNSPEAFRWASVIAQHSLLQTCQAYQVPRKLQFMISMIITSAKTGVLYEPQTTELLTLELRILNVGSSDLASRTSLSKRRCRSKR